MLSVSMLRLWLTMCCSKNPPGASDTLHNEIFAGKCTRLIKAANIDSARKWDAERLSAENGWMEVRKRMSYRSRGFPCFVQLTEFGQSNKGSIDS